MYLKYLRNKKNLVLIIFFFLFLNNFLYAQNLPIPSIEFKINDAKTPSEVSLTIRFFLLLTILSLAPSIIIMVTSFTRIIIVLFFLRMGLQTQNIPPNIVLISLALFLTFKIMSPTFNEIYNSSYKPFMDGKISIEEAYKKGIQPLKNFMLRYTREKDLALFIPKDIQNKEIPVSSLIPAFIISELNYSFQMGALLIIPFLLVDLIVASILLSMGM
ncbi:MAG: flagellar type III secretion system pore protein FliP, partial [bacterium]|nr:flagellar type III secretion system pore protein FliP [bacterium]MDW8163680.1 flagellar type III secretion system pore protein FliP [Candidatus Omnitrophota bacterium]